MMKVDVAANDDICHVSHTDDEALNQDLPDLINDDVEDEGSNDDERSVHGDGEAVKRRHSRDSDIDEDLEDDDYDLIEENLGVRVDRVRLNVLFSWQLTSQCDFISYWPVKRFLFTHWTDSTDSSCFSFFSGMSVLTLALCARLSWLTISF